MLFTLLYKIDVKQTRIKVYCCGGWLVEKQSLSQNFTETWIKEIARQSARLLELHFCRQQNGFT